MDEAEAVVGVRISCVLSDACLWFCGEIAEERAATWVVFWTSGAAAVSAHFHTDLFREEIGTQGVEARKDELVGIVPGF
ncbi:Kaempferol 3-O-beta-D-galactosyltransferase-like protein [Drosera capensis]